MNNPRAILLVVASMAAFSMEDMFVKFTSRTLSVGTILIMLGLGGALVFGTLARRHGQPLVSRDVFSRFVMLRSFGELVAALGFVCAIWLVGLSIAAAILQVTPLAVTLAAALFLGESVGWRRWSAIAIGFLGVLMITRPGFEGFQPAALLALIAVAGITLRDLSTRMVPATVSSTVVSCYGFLALVPAGLILLLILDEPSAPAAHHFLLMAGAVIFGTLGYYAIVAAMRMGEISVISPYRYTRLFFSVLIGVVVFHERPDIWTLGGISLILATGLYSFAREQKLSRQSARDTLGAK